MSSLDPIAAQQRLISSWSGRPLDGRGLLRILNEDGSRPPILWIFNSAKEPIPMAAALGADQPLVFSRSAHLLVRPNDDPVQVSNVLTDYLYQEIKLRFPHVNFDMGTSCQGSRILMRLSNLLREGGIGVGGLCMINCPLPEIVTDLPAFLVYGESDPAHDPFRKDIVVAKERAEKVFSRYKRTMVNAKHGQFYAEGTIRKILAQFEVFSSSKSLESSLTASESSSTVG